MCNLLIQDQRPTIADQGRRTMLSCLTDSYKYLRKSSLIQLELVTQACYFIQYLSIKEFPLTYNLSGDHHETI